MTPTPPELTPPELTPPDYPIGPFTPPANMTIAARKDAIATIARAPIAMRTAVRDLTKDQLNTRYRNWTIRQIVHHTADSHANSYVRFKWTLTEDTPTIKAYNESHWSDLKESRTGDIEPSLQMLDGLHARWAQLLRAMTDDDFNLAYIHPDSGDTTTLATAVALYAWHGRHHTGQIIWLRENSHGPGAPT